MSAPNKNLKFIIKTCVFVAAALFIIFYSYVQAKNLIYGPQINIDYPQNGVTVHDSLLELTGQVKNIAKINLNDRAINIDENGNFREKILLSSGYNIIKVDAEDKFGRSTQKLLEVIYK